MSIASGKCCKENFSRAQRLYEQQVIQIAYQPSTFNHLLVISPDCTLKIIPNVFLEAKNFSLFSMTKFVALMARTTLSR